jgi:hypothetical protein
MSLSLKFLLSQHTHTYVRAALYFTRVLKHKLLHNCRGDGILNYKLKIKIISLFCVHYYYYYYYPTTTYGGTRWRSV